MSKKYKIPTIEELFDAGVHFGHQVKRWNPGMEKYIYTVKNNIHIIDLGKTEELLGEAADFLYEQAKIGGKIIFVGTKKQSRDIIELESKKSGALYVTERWLGGTITNFDIIKKNNIDKLLSLKNRKETGDLEKYTKKERLLIDREIERLEKYVGGLTSLKEMPKAIFVVDVRREKTAIHEAKRANIPVVALIDTNSDPKDINYPIPGNDDAIKSIACIVKVLAEAIEAGYKDYASHIKDIEEKQKAEEKTEVEQDRTTDVIVSSASYNTDESSPELSKKESDEIIAEVEKKEVDKENVKKEDKKNQTESKKDVKKTSKSTTKKKKLN